MANKNRLDKAMLALGLVSTRSQAESFIRMKEVTVNGKVISKPGCMVSDVDKIKLIAKEQYVSRAGLKLASVSKVFNLDFRGKVVLDVGSSTGGFTDYALRHGADKVIAVDVGTDQLHPSLRTNAKIELYEQTDIRDMQSLSSKPDYIVMDVSFISLREILPHLLSIAANDTKFIAMVKPQFEAIKSDHKHKGVIKNEKVRREILKDFEVWAMKSFKILSKADSQVVGEKGNKERFYFMTSLPK